MRTCSVCGRKTYYGSLCLGDVLCPVCEDWTARYAHKLARRADSPWLVRFVRTVIAWL